MYTENIYSWKSRIGFYLEHLFVKVTYWYLQRTFIRESHVLISTKNIYSWQSRIGIYWEHLFVKVTYWYLLRTFVRESHVLISTENIYSWKSRIGIYWEHLFVKVVFYSLFGTSLCKQVFLTCEHIVLSSSMIISHSYVKYNVLRYILHNYGKISLKRTARYVHM